MDGALCTFEQYEQLDVRRLEKDVVWNQEGLTMCLQWLPLLASGPVKRPS